MQLYKNNTVLVSYVNITNKYFSTFLEGGAFHKEDPIIRDRMVEELKHLKIRQGSK